MTAAASSGCCILARVRPPSDATPERVRICETPARLMPIAVELYARQAPGRNLLAIVVTLSASPAHAVGFSPSFGRE